MKCSYNIVTSVQYVPTEKITEYISLYFIFFPTERRWTATVEHHLVYSGCVTTEFCEAFLNWIGVNHRYHKDLSSLSTEHALSWPCLICLVATTRISLLSRLNTHSVGPASSFSWLNTSSSGCYMILQLAEHAPQLSFPYLSVVSVGVVGKFETKLVAGTMPFSIFSSISVSEISSNHSSTNQFIVDVGSAWEASQCFSSLILLTILFGIRNTDYWSRYVIMELAVASPPCR